MSEVTAVPLRPIKKGSLAKLWIGIGEIQDRQESELIARAARQLVHLADILAVTG